MSKTGLPALRILGVDPGLRVTGFGVIEKVGSRLRYLASGCIRTQVSDSLPTRLGTIHTGLRELVAKHRPDEAATEIVFVNVNPQSTLLLGQARGAAISALVTSGLAVAEYTALQVKQAVVGNGHHAHGGHGLGNLAAGGLQVRGGRLILGKAIGQQGGNER